MSIKNVLSIETSADLCSASLSFSPYSFDERNVLIKHIHSERLIPVIDDLFRDNQFSKGELDCIAVSMGPGSFTGLRIGMTAAKGIAFALKIPIVPVPTFDALAVEIKDYLPSECKFSIINNANKDECYYGAYYFNGSTVEILTEISLIDKKMTSGMVNDSGIIFGNLNGIPNIKPISSPRASSIAKWTYLFGEDLLTFDYDYLEPNYLKNFKVKKNK